MEDCRQLLRAAGFAAVSGADGSRVALAPPAARREPAPTPAAVATWAIDREQMAALADRYFMVDERCCGESILKSGCEALGIRSELFPDIALGLGGGIGLQGHVCGAVSAAALVVSLALAKKTPDYGSRKMATFQAAGRVCAALEKRFGSVECRQMCGLDLTTGEGLGRLMSGVKAEKCAGFVKETARVLADELSAVLQGNANAEPRGAFSHGE